MTSGEAYVHCRAVTRAQARNFYYGFVLLDPPRRDGIYAAYAFSRRCDDSVDGDEPLAWKLDQLAARRREVADCAAGRPTASDPVLVALADAIARFGIPRGSLDALVDGVEMDLTTTRYATFADLKRYCDRVAGAVGVVSLHVFGFEDPAAVAHAEDLGVAMQLVNIMRDVGEDAERGRIYLPREEMDRHGVREADILGGRATAGFRALMASQGARAHEYFDGAVRLLPLLDRRSRMCVSTLAGLYQAILAEIESRDYDVLHERVQLSTARKLRLMGQRSLAGLAPR